MLSASIFTGTLRATTLRWPRTLRGGVGGAGEGDDVVGGQMVEQVAGAADQQIERAFGQHLRLDHVAHHLDRPACAVAEAGLANTGTPASSDTAAFSHSPQLGKLKALMCTATPRRGTIRWMA